MLSDDSQVSNLSDPALSRFFTLAIDLLGIANFDGHFVKLNPAWETVTGYSQAELLARPFFELVHPEDLEVTAAQAVLGQAVETTIQFENRIRCKDGRYKWVSWSGVTYPAERLFYFVGRDVSRRRVAELRLKEHMERLSIAARIYSELSRKLDLPYILDMSLDHARRISNAEAGFIALVEAEGRVHFDLSFGGYKRDGNVPYLADHQIVGQAIRTNEIQWIRDLSTAPGHISVLPNMRAQIAIPLWSAQFKRMVAILCLETLHPEHFDDDVVDFLQLVAAHIAISITRARLVESLRLSEERFHKVFQSSPDGIFIADLYTEHCIEVNASFLYYTELSREDLVGRTTLEAGLWDSPDDYAQIQKLIREQSMVREYEVRYRKKKSGGTGVALVSADLVFLEDRPCLFTITRDITERKQGEVEREELIKELNSFAHTVAHDLKNPLQLLLGYASLLEEDSTLPAEQLDMVHEIVRTTERMRRIVDELLRLASLRSLTEIPKHSLHMERIVHEALQRLRLLIRDNQAEIVLPDTWPIAVGYAPWVEEIWANYLSNAMKYGGRPPVITLGGTDLPDDSVRFWVKDNGQGMSAEQQAQLFHEFARLDNVRVEGHGLGLSIVKRIVEKLGGQVGVESKPGEGSTFWFTLPSTLPDPPPIKESRVSPMGSDAEA